MTTFGFLMIVKGIHPYEVLGCKRHSLGPRTTGGGNRDHVQGTPQHDVEERDGGEDPVPLYPHMRHLGFDPIWSGVIVIIPIGIGLIRPPVALDACQLSGVTGIYVSTICRGAIPFLIATLVGILLVIFLPQIPLYIPNTM